MLESFLQACELEPIKSIHRILAALLLLAASSSAEAWGYEGHRVVALVAPSTRAKVDALLPMDADPLTGHDMASEATWADAYRALTDIVRPPRGASSTKSRTVHRAWTWRVSAIRLLPSPPVRGPGSPASWTG